MLNTLPITFHFVSFTFFYTCLWCLGLCTVISNYVDIANLLSSQSHTVKSKWFVRYGYEGNNKWNKTNSLKSIGLQNITCFLKFSTSEHINVETDFRQIQSDQNTLQHP